MKKPILRIIDNPYGSKFTSTDTSTGVTVDIKESTARGFAKITSGVFLTARANVNLKSVPQHEIFPGTSSALASL
jgi:hypothetical protein